MKEEKMITASNKEADEAVVPKKHDYDSDCTGECIFGTVMILDKVAKNDNIPTITMNCEY